MRNTSPLHWTLLVALLASPVGAVAQNTTDGQEPDDSPPPAPITTIAQSEQIGAYVVEAFQDRDGNHWFGLGGVGVCRYDGKSLTYFDRELSGSRELRGDGPVRSSLSSMLRHRHSTLLHTCDKQARLRMVFFVEPPMRSASEK